MIKTVIDRTITTAMFFIAVVIVGILAVCNIPKDLFPEMKIPYVIVLTSYQGAGPSEVESLVTKPLESALSSVSDLKEMTSQSSNGTSIVIMEFNDSVDMDIAALNVREKVDLIKDYLPSDTTSPMIMKINPTALPIMSITVSSEKYDVVKLNSFLEDNVIPRIEKIGGVADVTTSGGKDRQIKVTCYPEKLQAYGLTTSTLSSLLAAENLNLPGGQLLEGEKDITIRTIGEFSSIEDVKNIPIQTQYGIIYLRDIAEIEDTYKDVTSYSFINGQEAIGISINKQSVANTVKVCEKINKEIEKIENEYAGMIDIKIQYDSSVYINDSIGSVGKSALIGGLLAIIVLYIFLRNIWPTLVIATSIPTSILSTFMLMYLTDMTLNIVTLGALTIAIGMLVDASIVVLENIDVHRKMGKSSKEAALDGAKEVTLAVFASTLTSVVVFLPFVFTSGTIMQMLHVFAWVIMFALASSIVTALTLVPMLSAKLPDQKKKVKWKWVNDFAYKCKDWLEKLEVFYGNLLESALNNKRKVVKITLWICGISLVCILFTDKTLMPESDEGQYSITCTLPEGTSLEKTLELATDLTEKISDLKVTKNVMTSVGGASSVMSGGSSNVASITVDVGPAKKRSKTIDECVSEARKITNDIPGCEFELGSSSSSMSGMMGGSGVQLVLTGDDNDKLHEIADDLVARFSEIPGLVEVQKGVTEGVREARIEIDRTKLSLYGIQTVQVASAVQTAITGSTATSIKMDGDEIDVVVAMDDTSVKYIKDLTNIFVTSPTTGQSVSLVELGDVVLDNTATTITRTNQKLTLTVEAVLDGISLGEAQSRIEKNLKSYTMPSGYSAGWSGSLEMMEDAFRSLFIAIIMAILLVYMVMASQFESLFDPFIIMFTIPLAFAGSFIGLFITFSEIDVVSIMGMIVLVGIVVNNGIILIDFIIRARAEGVDMITATIQSGKQRLRPILMTTLTTILGMIPMALQTGSGSELKGLAIVVIFGLMTSTCLTLVLIPVIYVYMHQKLDKRISKRKVQKYIKKNEIK